MEEVEVKYRCGDLGAVKERLRELGAEPLGRVEMRDTYYQHPCWDFAERDEALRLREYQGACIVTYKGPRRGGWAKAREEIEFRASSCRDAHSLLLRLGFRPVATIVKRREFYALWGTEVAVDQVEGLGGFVEVEDKGGGIEAVKRVVEALGLTEGPIPESYLELYLRRLGGRRALSRRQ